MNITVESVLSGKDGWNPKTGKAGSAMKVVPASAETIEPIKKSKATAEDGNSVYLFTSFRGDGEDGLHLAYSFNGIKWTALDGSFLKPQVGTGKLMKDPSLLQDPNGLFHLVWANGLKDDQGFGYARSKDLIHWSEQKYVGIMAEQKALDVAAPKLFYDEAGCQFIITWASTLPANFYQAFQEDVNDNPRLWYTTTPDFETFTPAKPFFEPGYSVKDGVILRNGTGYALVHKDNRRMTNTLRVAFSDKPLGPWGPSSDPFTPGYCEAPAVLRFGDERIVYFEITNEERYGAVKTKDFKTWTDITKFISFPKGYHYGTALRIPAIILKRLERF